MKELVVSKETQKIVANKLDKDQLFVLLVLAIAAIMGYFLIEKVSSKIDESNNRLDKLIDLQEQNLLLLKDHIYKGIVK